MALPFTSVLHFPGADFAFDVALRAASYDLSYRPACPRPPPHDFLDASRARDDRSPSRLFMPGVRRNTNAVWPPPTVPPNETEGERLARLEQEEEAKRTSDAIDSQLRAERDARKKSSVKILLLGACPASQHDPTADNFPGQAESGKSTMLKNFQLHFAPNAFTAEVRGPFISLWRAYP